MLKCLLSIMIMNGEKFCGLMGRRATSGSPVRGKCFSIMEIEKGWGVLED